MKKSGTAGGHGLKTVRRRWLAASLALFLSLNSWCACEIDTSVRIKHIPPHKIPWPVCNVTSCC